MKNEVDSLGRFVIPIKYRRKMNIKAGDELDVIFQQETLILKKANPTCVFCNSTDDLTSFEEKMVCCHCIEKIKKGS